MGECKSPYNRGRGEICIYERDANGPTNLKCCPVKCYPPVCYDKVDVEFSCGTTTTTTTTTPCPAFSGMKLYFSACHSCDRARYEFYVGALDSDGKWDELSSVLVPSISGSTEINLDSFGPNAKTSNPYPCNGEERKNKNGFKCCIDFCPRLSVDEAEVSETIVNNIQTSPGDSKDCVKIAVKLKCIIPSGCHSDVTQFYAIGSDGCCLGGGTLDANTDSEGHGLGVKLIELCCNGCEICIDKSFANDTSIPADIIYGEQTVSVPDEITLPTKVTISGSVDDDLVVDGEIINRNNTAGTASHTFVLYNSTFTIAGYNAIAGGASYNYKICFNSKSETTTTTTQSPGYYYVVNFESGHTFMKFFPPGLEGDGGLGEFKEVNIPNWLSSCECIQPSEDIVFGLPFDMSGLPQKLAGPYPTQSECCYEHLSSCYWAAYRGDLNNPRGEDKNGNVNDDWTNRCEGVSFINLNEIRPARSEELNCINSNTFISNCISGEISKTNQYYAGSGQNEFVLCYKNKGRNEFIIKNEKEEIIKNIIIEEDKEDVELISKPEGSDYIVIETKTKENSFWEYCLLCPETINHLLKETENGKIKTLSTQSYGCKFIVNLDTTGCCIEVEEDKLYSVGEGTLYASVDSGSPGDGEGLECCSNPIVKICEIDSSYCTGGGCAEGEFGASKYLLDGCEFTVTVMGNNSSYSGGEQDCDCKNPNDRTKEEGYPTGTESHPDPCQSPFRIMKNKNSNGLKILINKNFIR